MKPARITACDAFAEGGCERNGSLVVHEQRSSSSRDEQIDDGVARGGWLEVVLEQSMIGLASVYGICRQEIGWRATVSSAPSFLLRQLHKDGSRPSTVMVPQR